MKVRTQKIEDWSIIILINIMWATQVPAVKLVGDRMGPITIAFVPLIISTVLFIPLLLIENRKRKVHFRWRFNEIKPFILPGLAGVALMQYAYTLGSTMTSEANAGILTLTIPVFVTMFASLMLGEKLNTVRITGFLLTLGGVALTSLPDLAGANLMRGSYLTGNIVFLIACGLCAFYNTYCKILVEKKYTELEILVYSSLVASIAGIPLLIWVQPLNLPAIFHSGKTVLAAILELSLVVYGVSLLLFFYVLKRMDVSQAILGNYLLPFFIALLGVLIFHEKITPLMYLGGGIIIISTLMVSVYEKELLAFFRKGDQRAEATDQ